MLLTSTDIHTCCAVASPQTYMLLTSTDKASDDIHASHSHQGTHQCLGVTPPCCTCITDRERERKGGGERERGRGREGGRKREREREVQSTSYEQGEHECRKHI
jgi:hypothetical protein